MITENPKPHSRNQAALNLRATQRQMNIVKAEARIAMTWVRDFGTSRKGSAANAASNAATGTIVISAGLFCSSFSELRLKIGVRMSAAIIHPAPEMLIAVRTTTNTGTVYIWLPKWDPIVSDA